MDNKELENFIQEKSNQLDEKRHVINEVQNALDEILEEIFRLKSIKKGGKNGKN